MSIWSNIATTSKNMFKIPELRHRILVTIGLLLVYRLGFHIPVPGIDPRAIEEFFATQGGPLKDIMGTFAMLSGGSLLQCTLFALGIMPYISSEIIFQLLTKVIPKLEALSKEGDAGRRKIRQYSRYTTVAICVVQATFVLKFLLGQVPNAASGGTGFWFFVVAVMTLTAGTFFLMWLGEMITEHGLGNGVSLIIMAGIVASVPAAIIELVGLAQEDYKEFLPILLIIALFFFVVAGILMITLGQRRIPIQQAKHVRGHRVYGGQRQYLPLKVDQPGVIPIIFASALLTFPQMLFTYLERGVFERDSVPWRIANIFNEQFARNAFFFVLCYVVLVFFFCFFWTKLMFNPVDLAKNMKEYGSFIPGIRPGKRTVEYIDHVVNRITLAGAFFLSVIAVLPMVLSAALGVTQMVTGFLGGTGLLIVVGVALDLVQKVEAHLVMRHYDGFFGAGGMSVRGRRG